jgi:hypothetical protein
LDPYASSHSTGARTGTLMLERAAEFGGLSSLFRQSFELIAGHLDDYVGRYGVRRYETNSGSNSRSRPLRLVELGLTPQNLVRLCSAGHLGPSSSQEDRAGKTKR